MNQQIDKAAHQKFDRSVKLGFCQNVPVPKIAYILHISASVDPILSTIVLLSDLWRL